MDTQTSTLAEPRAAAQAEAAPPPPALPAPQGAAGSGLELISGKTMRTALLAARQSLGEKAVVIDQRAEGGRVTLAVSTVVPRSTDALAVMRKEAAQLLNPPRVKPVVRPASPAGVERNRTPLADVERRLRENGASKKLRERILESVAMGATGGEHPLDLAAVEVGSQFHVASLPVQAGQLEIIALVGQTGVGKTTTLAKLAMRLARAGRRVLLATLDGERVGASAQLEGYGRLLRIPTLAVDSTAELANALAGERTPYDVLLIDGTGTIAADVDSLGQLENECASQGLTARLSALVVLPATASAAVLEATTKACAPLEPIGAVVTKIDEASQPLPAIEHAAAHDLGIAFLTNGPELGPHFFRASAERFADVALIGRLG